MIIPDVVTKVSITIVVSGTSIITRHVDEIGSSIAMAADIAHIDRVGELFVHEVCL